MTDLRTRPGVAASALVNLLAAGTGAVVALVLAAVVGRHIGAGGAGTYFTAVAAVTIAAHTAELGADTRIVRFVAAARARGDLAAVPALVRLALAPVVVTLAASCGAVGLAVALGADAAFDLPGPILLAGAAAAAALTGTTVLLSITRGLGDALTFPAVLNVALPLGRLLGVGVAVVLGAEAAGVLVGWFAPALLALVLAALAARRAVRRLAIDRPATDEGPAFWRFSAARGAAAVVEISLEWVDVLLVGALAGTTEAGVYAVVTRCVRAGEVVQQAARVVVGPGIAAAFARDDRAAAARLYGVVAAAMVWLAWPAYALLAVFGERVLAIFGPDFGDGATALALLAGVMAVSTATGTAQSVVLMAGRSHWQLLDKSVALVVMVVLDLLLVPEWGVTGAAIAWAAAIGVDTALVLWQVRRGLDLRPDDRPLLWAAALALVVVALPALLVRATLGQSVVTVVVTALTLAVVYLAASVPLRHRLGLVSLTRLRAE